MASGETLHVEAATHVARFVSAGNLGIHLGLIFSAVSLNERPRPTGMFVPPNMFNSAFIVILIVNHIQC